MGHASFRSPSLLKWLHALVRRLGEPRFWARLKRNGHLRLIPRPRPHLPVGRGRSLWEPKFRVANSCHCSFGRPLEIVTVDPHTVKDHGHFSRDRHYCFAASLGFHEIHAPCF